MRYVLIISTNFEFCICVNNNMLDNSKIVNISTTFDEGIENIKKLRPGVIILELNLKYCDILYLQSEINKISGYNPKILIVSNLNLTNIEEKFLNCNVIEKKGDIHLIVSRILKYMESEKIDDLIENRIVNEMKKVGFEMRNKGDYYILGIVKFIMTHKNTSTDLKNDIYPTISKFLDTDEQKIKWNINYAVNSVYDVKPKKVCSYLHIDESDKPSPKYLLLSLINNL